MSITPESTKTEQSKHSDMITAFEAQASAGKKTIPAFSCWSSGDGECWHTHPADACILDTVFSDGAPKVGDEYEVLAGWPSVEARYRITSVDEDGDVEVECISHAMEAAPQPDRVAKLTAEVERRRAALSGLLEFAEEVRRSGDTRLASMAIAVIAKATGKEAEE